MRKIIIIIMKKKICAEPFLGYCLNYIVKKENFCIARKALYCDIVALDV